jgi:hypothetical protein
MKYVVALPFLALSACAGGPPAPSLAPRPAEATRPDDPVATAAAQPLSITETATLASALAAARKADSAFAEAIGSASVQAAAGSEAWIAAQSARSAAEVARGPALDALATLDAALREATEQGRDTTALTAARDEVQAITDRQVARLDALSR